ncbi:MAG: hypothetical protein WCF28_00760 [Methanobacterium sp.]
MKVCDVDSSGKNLNVCDGIQRLFPNRPPAQSDGHHKSTNQSLAYSL